jgi:adenine/guanine/hypoxanthine permease
LERQLQLPTLNLLGLLFREQERVLFRYETGVRFHLVLFFSPLPFVITSEVAGPALSNVDVMMASSLGKVERERFEIAVPAYFMIIAKPLRYSIATGIVIGFIFYPITMIVSGRRNRSSNELWNIIALHFLFIK